MAALFRGSSAICMRKIAQILRHFASDHIGAFCAWRLPHSAADSGCGLLGTAWRLLPNGFVKPTGGKCPKVIWVANLLSEENMTAVFDGNPADIPLSCSISEHCQHLC